MTFPFCLLLLLLFGAAEAAEKCTFDVQATAETPKLREEGDRPPDADDAAVWTNGTHALIVGTLKEGGLATFLPDGSQKERISLPPPSSGNKPARFNNVVVLDGLVVVTDRGQDILRFYTCHRKPHPRGKDPGREEVGLQQDSGRGQQAAHSVRVGWVRQRRTAVRRGHQAC
eukprot:Sspe_Gene.12302::Locus_4189_Transcript_1_1_Confidence_1.000_Length_1455::g.12302::m.12302